LIHFVSDKSKMKGFHISRATQIAAWIIASIIVSLNAKLVFDEITGWLETAENPIILWLTVVPLAVGFLVLLLYIVFKPFFVQNKLVIKNHSPHHLDLKFSSFKSNEKKNIAVTVDFSNADEKALQHAIDLGGKEANYTLIHVVETVGAMMYGKDVSDHETTIDEELLLEYVRMLNDKGYQVVSKLGFGKPGKSIAKTVNDGHFDILIMGTHGHHTFKDLLFGTTVDQVRHEIKIPLFIIKN